MKVIPCGKAGASRRTDNVPLGDHLVRRDLDAAEMTVHAKKAETMIYKNGIAINTQVFGKCNPSVIGGRDC